MPEPGEIWFSSQSGLFRYDKGNESLMHFDTKQGLLSNEIFGRAVKLSDGLISFNTLYGIQLIDVMNLRFDAYTSPIAITNIALESTGDSFHLENFKKKPLVLDYDDYGLSFYFSNFDFFNQLETRYLISLIGPTDLHYDNYEKNEIEFTRLLPGNYKFSVAAYSPVDGKLGEAQSVSFTVKYNPLTSPIALASYILSFLLLFGFIYHRRLKQQALVEKVRDDSIAAKQRASFALEASNSGIWVYDSKQHYITQARYAKELGYDDVSGCSLHTHLSLIHPQDRQRLEREWHAFSKGHTEFWDVTYRVRAKNGVWQWYRDLGKLSKASIDQENPVYTGTYTNISDTKNKEMQAHLYGEALRKMNDWLLILDHKFRPLASNAAFKSRFLTKGEVVTTETLKSIFDDEMQAYYFEHLPRLKVGDRLRKEEVFTFDDCRIPVLLSISAIGEQEVTNYVVVASDLSQQKAVEYKLTQLANRTLIKDRIEQAILHAKNEVISLLYIDLDRFKQVNDSLGHGVGDKLLIEVASRMQDVVGKEHSVGRQSGDEFIILFEDVSSPEAISQYANKLNKSLSEPYLIENNTINISSSIGIAFYPFDAEDTEELVRNADIAMIHAKNSGRNCYRFYTEQLNKDAKNRLLLENELVSAVKQNILTNFYQPIINTQSQKVVGVELLLRWFREGEMVSPGVFIPLAEQIGQIVNITELALAKATAELGTWLASDSNRYLSINLSALHISEPKLVERFLSILNKANVGAEQIRLEITEGILIEDTVNALEQLEKLKQAGFKLYLDDFGTGYSSLTYINQFPIDVIKIDQSFIRQMNASKTNQAIVQTIASLATNLGTYCIAEGVEELIQVSVLKRLGCYNLQGFYFAKPVPIHTLLSDEFQSEVQRKIMACKNA